MSFSAYLPCIESTIEESNPDPAQNKENKHQREGKDKPWAEVYEVAFREVATDTNMQDIESSFIVFAPPTKTVKYHKYPRDMQMFCS